jgi:multidrug efflux system membrane fusion protein
MLDEASIRIAKISLNYCFISSPIDGVAGKRQVDAGNIVSANAGPTLVNIKTIDNLYLDFTISERQLAQVRDAMLQSKLKVQISPEGDGQDYEGEVVFIDNKVDDATGTVAMRALVPNKERKLWAGEIVQVRLILRTEKGAVVVPYQAVQLGQKGSYVFVVTSDNTADLRDVTPGIRFKDSIVIEKGIKAGEKVVTEGQMGLSSGVPVFDITQQKKEDTKESKKKETKKK